MSQKCQIRRAIADDAPTILGFIKELASFEKLSHEVEATEELLVESLFGPNSRAEVILACVEEQVVGFALYFHNYSTFLGRSGLYLEDLYVSPKARGQGIGKTVLVYLAALAKQRNCGRLEWSVLDWNEDAIRFYRRLGAVAMDEWSVYRVSGDALNQLAEIEE